MSAGGGGKLQRSETVTVRLDPRLNYLVEMAARRQRRTKSAYIEWLISQDVEATGPELTQLWDTDPRERLEVLRECAPHLLTFDEEWAWDKEIKAEGSEA